MAQTSVSNAPVSAYEGKPDTQPERIISGLASELIYFGKALSRSLTASLNRNPAVEMYTSGEAFVGVAMADPSVERLPSAAGLINQAAYGAFVSGREVPVVKRGRLWVVSADAVDNLSKSVYVRNTDPAGSATAATITDTTTYPVTDQDGLTSIITIVDGGVGSAAGAQTVTFSGAHTTAAQIAASMNAQLVGCSVAVVGGQVKITTDAKGAGVTIAAAAGTGNLTWGTPVAGTGVITPPANTRGSFRATTATGYTDLGAIAAVKWVAAQTIGGVYYGLLDINVP